MNCCGCKEKLHFWQRHDGTWHDRCRKAWSSGHRTAWNFAEEELQAWHLPNLIALCFRGSEESGPPSEVYEIERQIAERKPVFVEPTVENGMLAEGESKENP